MAVMADRAPIRMVEIAASYVDQTVIFTLSIYAVQARVFVSQAVRTAVLGKIFRVVDTIVIVTRGDRKGIVGIAENGSTSALMILLVGHHLSQLLPLTPVVIILMPVVRGVEIVGRVLSMLVVSRLMNVIITMIVAPVLGVIKDVEKEGVPS